MRFIYFKVAYKNPYWAKFVLYKSKCDLNFSYNYNPQYFLVQNRAVKFFSTSKTNAF